MKDIFETCNVSSDGNELERAFPKMLKVNYTETEEAWDQFYKTLFWPKFFRINFPPQMLDNFQS
jgi:hypothetical protein